MVRRRVTLPGCDKNMPGCVIGMARVDRPSLMIYGGTIRPGSFNGKPVDVVSAFQSYGELLAGKLSETDRAALLRAACPGAGACGGMYTANTMATAIEALGMSLPGSSSAPATAPEKIAECRAAGAAVRRLLELDLKPSQIMTRAAFENAMAVVVAIGGSTNAVLHLIAMARAVSVDLSIDDFQATSDRVPLLGDFKPSGRYVMEDLHQIGGTPAVLRLLLARGLLHGDCITVTGTHPGGEPRQRAGPQCGAGSDPLVRRSGKPARAHPHPARQPRARGRGGEDHRQGG